MEVIVNYDNTTMPLKQADQTVVLILKRRLFADQNIGESKFYISLPIILNNNIALMDSTNFTYEFKYALIEGNVL